MFWVIGVHHKLHHIASVAQLVSYVSNAVAGTNCSFFWPHLGGGILCSQFQGFGRTEWAHASDGNAGVTINDDNFIRKF